MGWKRLFGADAECPRRAATRDAWTSVRKSCIVSGSGADRRTRREAFYRSSSVARNNIHNLHTTIPGYKFERKKKQVDVVIDMRAAMTPGCHFSLGE
eukprot:3792396-Pyramimonas_sp.AAC.1